MPTCSRCRPARIPRSAGSRWRNCSRTSSACVAAASPLQRRASPALDAKGTLVERLRASLPFALTAAQQRVFAEVRDDLARPHPMLRLVQGDVGSGKTVVAAMAALQAIECGRQAALMAPTELLAEQHLANLAAWLEPLGVRVGWLAGKVGGKARARVLADAASGDAQLLVGTHALMQEGVGFHDLALASSSTSSTASACTSAWRCATRAAAGIASRTSW